MNNNLTTLTLKKNNIYNFAFERNKLLKKAKSEWVLFLDSDEKLCNSVGNVSENYDGYILKRKNYFLGQYVGDDKIVRLGKRKFRTWERSVHEIWNIRNLGIINNNYIIHNTADNLSGYIKKINFYSDLHAKANLKEFKRSSIFKIIFFPIGKFVMTFIKSRHLVFSIMQSFHSYLSWTKMYFRPVQK